MKYIYKLLIAPYLVLQFFNANAQAPGCPNVNAGNDQNINCIGSAQLTATALHTGATNTYSVSSIPYAPPYPYNTGTPILVNIDDTWSGVIQLPFTFCYYGNQYTQIVAGSNGVVSFNTSNANGYCPWSFTDNCPSPNLPLNSIFGAYHDIDPSVTGTMYQAVLGSYPCRTFVVNWNQVAMYSGVCNSLLATHQIVLYEATNVIEVYIQNKPLCSSWNGGRAIVGIQDASGLQGLTAPNRNSNPTWTAQNEAWRFTPNGLQNYSIAWFDGTTQISTTPNVTVAPTATTTYTAVCTYINCDGSVIVVDDSVTVNVLNPIDLVVTPLNDTICEGESTTISASGAYNYSWTPTTNLTLLSDSVVVVTPPTTTTYTLVVTDQQNTCTGSVDIEIIVIPPPNVEVIAIPNNICEGDTSILLASNASTFEWNDMTTINPYYVTPSNTTTYTVTGYDDYGCSNSASVTVNVSSIPIITFTPPNPAICEGETASVQASGGSFYTWSNSTTANPLVVSPTSTTTYQVTASDPLGICFSTSEVTVTVFDNSIADFSGENLDGCAPLAAAFTDESTNANQWEWSFGDANTSSQQNPIHSYNTAGLYDVTLIVTSVDGCKDTLQKTAFVEVYPQPIASFTWTPEVGKVYDPTITFHSNATAQYWFWDFGDGATSTSSPPVTHTYPGEENTYTVTLVVSNEHGCIDSTQHIITILDDILVFPNVITPNGDGYNDFFVITNADKYPGNILKVYNRWGKMVFEMSNYDNSWNGGNLSDGSYYFVFYYLDKSHHGSLSIIRN
jgi:gliding motility-associated-like protein